MTDAGTKRVILVGAGHAHLHVVRHARAFVRRGIELLLVDPDRFWYSGLATGMLGGMYAPDDDQINPEQLAARSGARFVRDRMIGLDADARTVRLRSGTELAYAALSLNLGSQVSNPGFHLPSPSVWPVKPVSNLWGLRQRLEKRIDRDNHRIRVLVIGGGATGCEVAASIDALARRRNGSVSVTLVTRGSRLLPGHPRCASNTLVEALERRGIAVLLSTEVNRTENGEAVTSLGDRIAWDEIVLATGLEPPAITQALGLPVDDRGGLEVEASLQCRGRDRVFGAGDCVSIDGHRLPKLGVYGVRAAPVLLHNLLAVLDGAPLKSYRPQRRALIILNLGCGEGLAIRGHLYWRGTLSLRLKDRIDLRFMAKYRAGD